MLPPRSASAAANCDRIDIKLIYWMWAGQRAVAVAKVIFPALQLTLMDDFVVNPRLVRTSVRSQ